jgi:hypothetical protein
MKDELVTKETALLAKEKGFDCRNEDSYWSYLNENSTAMCYHEKTCVLHPTQSLLQRWLREVHNIIVFVAPFKDHAADVNDPLEWNYAIYGKSIGRDLKSYEEALEKGLQEALKLIPQNQ